MYSNKSPVQESPEVKYIDGVLKIKFKETTFTVKINFTKEVIEQSKLLSKRAWKEHQEEVSKSHTRFELSSTDDVARKYGVEVLLMVQAAADVGEIWAFDHQNGSYI